MQSEDSNGSVKLLVTLTRSQDGFLDQEVRVGRALSKQDAIRQMIELRMQLGVEGEGATS